MQVNNNEMTNVKIRFSNNKYRLLLLLYIK
jgi:hypothetical protein